MSEEQERPQEETPVQVALEEPQTPPVQKAPPPPQPAIYRVRLTYARLGGLRYVSHLDMQMVWERTLRRAAVPLAYSQGFNPRPRLHLACALPLGFASRCELTDFWIQLPPGEPCPDLNALASRIRASAPPGLEIRSAEQAPLSAPALQTQVRAAVYQAVPLDDMDGEAIQSAVQALLNTEHLPRERRGKPYDLRPLIETLTVDPTANPPVLTMRLTAREGATGRPEEVLAVLGLDFTAFRVERTALILED